MLGLEAFSDPGRLWRGNLHTHSTLSDGALPPEDVAEAYRAHGYDFLCLSDHFAAPYDWPLADTRDERREDFTTLIGAELHAPTTSAGELWHILAVGLPFDFAPPGDGEDGPALARRAREAGAFVTVAHPAWSQLTLDDGLQLAGVAHAVEVLNFGCGMENDRGDGWYLLEQLLRQGHRLTAVASDDAHFKHGPRDAFGGWVLVRAAANEPEALLAALRRGAFYATEGPEIHDVRVADNTVSIACSPVASISVSGGSSRSHARIEPGVTAAAFDLTQLRGSWLPEGSRSWFRVTLIDTGGRRAWSNPIWWDA